MVTIEARNVPNFQGLTEAVLNTSSPLAEGAEAFGRLLTLPIGTLRHLDPLS